MDIDDLVRYPTAEDETWYSRLNPKFPAMWGMLIEKAWAKSFSNFSALKLGGFSSQALRALNGSPSEYYHITNYDEWELFVNIFNAKK